MRTFKLILQIFSLFALFILSFSFCAHADEWICKEASSLRTANQISSCGIGYGKDENEARQSALNHAGDEFRSVCSLSADCTGHEILANPMRTSCDVKNGQFQCYRMIVFTIGQKKGSASLIQNDSKEVFKPFMISEVQKYPKIRAGMTKKQVFDAFGMPDSIDGSQIFYKGSMCQGVELCYVSLNSQNRVINYTFFNALYDGNLVD
jgi:hypothetical protein